MKDVFRIIEEHFPTLNDDQKSAIKATDGPVQIIAGPGSGKTFVLVLRTLYILLTGKAEPKGIVITTFTEKAAFELRDRIHQIANQLGFIAPFHEMKAGTIHGICSNFISQYRHRTPLQNNYELLDELTQNLFLYDHFDEIAAEPIGGLYLGKWRTKWTAIEGLVPYLNKITEELIEPVALTSSADEFIRALGKTYQRYRTKLFDENRLDFAHQQKIFLDMLQDAELEEKIKSEIKYIMVDEYQDTNYIQEQIILRLGHPDNNICVVGDEDQALYRFRGATVRNILEFQTHFENCQKITLSTNYRSHRTIVQKYDRFMSSIDWTNPDVTVDFRFPKSISPNPEQKFPKYPAVFCIWGINETDEANRFADVVQYLKGANIIEDYNQVALLLKSVRLEHSGHYIQALEKQNIPVYAPRARGYFNNPEVQLMVGCYAVIFGFHGEATSPPAPLHRLVERGVLRGAGGEVVDYTQSAISKLGPEAVSNPDLAEFLREKVKQISDLQRGETLDLQVADYFYHLLAFEPFSKFLKNENRARNLAIFSQLLTIFQNYYHLTVVTYRNRDLIKNYLFNSFLKFLLDGGINEYEDPDNPIPKGYVQIMTVHQSKGLEFPVVAVGSLDKQFRVGKQVDRDLASFFHRLPFEPEKRITEFDRMRHYYVAFSRAEKILVLTTTNTPQDFLNPIWEDLDQWPYVEREVLESLSFKPKPQFIPKKSYSLSSHINVYELCPRQYEFYREYKFSPSRSATMLFGSLVHQTIEDIHRWTLDGKLKKIDENRVRDFFERNYRSLLAIGMRPLAQNLKELAYAHVLNYFTQNYSELSRVIDTEVDVSVEKEGYILTGKIDLLTGEDGKLEVLDFKTSPKPDMDAPILDSYFKQLCVYAHILEQRYGKNPERLYIYWTAEKTRQDALTEFPFTREDIKKAGDYFDAVVKMIQQKKFDVTKPPDKTKICLECDFRNYCATEGTILL